MLLSMQHSQVLNGWHAAFIYINLLRCRAHDKGVTIQGAISAASAVATAACQAEDYPLPQTMLLQCPASVRKQAGSHCSPWSRCCVSLHDIIIMQSSLRMQSSLQHPCQGNT